MGRSKLKTMMLSMWRETKASKLRTTAKPKETTSRWIWSSSTIPLMGVIAASGIQGSSSKVPSPLASLRVLELLSLALSPILLRRLGRRTVSVSHIIRVTEVAADRSARVSTRTLSRVFEDMEGERVALEIGTSTLLPLAVEVTV